MDSEFEIERILRGKQKGGRLENWKRQYFSPEKYIIWGNCFDDACGRFPDNTRIHTSIVVAHHVEDRIIETLNSYYILGKPLGVDLTKKPSLTSEQLDLLVRSIV